MANYVILNFEDPDPNAGAVPNRFLGHQVGNAAGVGNAAKATANRYQHRIEDLGRVDGEVIFYPCQELIARDRNKALSRADVDHIRRDCESAKTIAILLHGELTDTDLGFASDRSPVCSWDELAYLMLLLLPDTRRYNIALIMCYGGRSSDAGLDHRGMISERDLKSSFAYKLYRRICQSRRIRMTARTGLVRSGYYQHEVETEEAVLRCHERSMEINLRGMDKTTMDQRRDALLRLENVTDVQFDGIVKKFALNPNKAPKNNIEAFAKGYVIYSKHFKIGTFDPAKLGFEERIGKLIYTFEGGVLEIFSRVEMTADGLSYSVFRGALV